MKSFIDPYALFFAKVLELLPKSPSLSVETKLDHSAFFLKIIAKFFRQQPFFELIRRERPFRMYQSQIKIFKDDTVIGSFGSSLNEENAILISQAEFLERISSWVPLEEAKEGGFFTKKTQEIASKRIVRSVLGMRYGRREMHELYWGMAKTEGEKRQVTTSGIAAHFDFQTAILNAWLEIIERDAFLMFWLNTISPPRINLNSDLAKSADLRNLLHNLETLGYEYYLLDIRSDIEVPTCLAILVKNTSGGRKVGIGAKAGFDGESVVCAALLEAVTVLESVMDKEPYSLPPDFSPFSDNRVDKDARVRLPLSEEGFSRMSFLFSSSRRVSLQDFISIPSYQEGFTGISLHEKIDYLKRIFKERYVKDRKNDVFIYNFNDKLINTFDFHVVRVICDALYPLYLSEHFADPQHPRLKEFVINKGLDKQAHLNNFPHPFP